MKYKVKTEIVTPGEHEIDVTLPLGAKNDHLLDQMVRRQTRDNPSGLVDLGPGEKITEVWREGERIYPRAVKDGRKKKNPAPEKAKSVEEQIAESGPGTPLGYKEPRPVWPSETNDEEGAA